MTAPLFALAGLLLYLAIFTANAQIPVGFTPGLPNGPFNGSHIDNDHSSVDIGSPSGRISFGLQETPNTWAKQLSFTGDINPGGLVSITEHLNWDGTGPAPFTDWHEQVLTSNFEWQAGSTISIGPSPGSVSSGNTQIDFNFPPQFSALDFTISKTLQYTGLSVINGGFTITIVEQATVPEPAHALIACGAVLSLWAFGRRVLLMRGRRIIST